MACNKMLLNEMNLGGSLNNGLQLQIVYYLIFP